MVSALDVMTPNEHKARRLSVLAAQFNIQEAQAKAAAQQQEQERKRQLQQFFAQHGAGIARGDPEATDALASIDPEKAIELSGKRTSNEKAAQDLQTSRIDARQKEFDLAKERMDYVMRALTAVENADPNVRGILYKRELAAYKQQFPDLNFQGIPEDYDPNVVKTMLGRVRTASEQLSALQASPEYIRQKADAEREPIPQAAQRAGAIAGAEAKARAAFPTPVAADKTLINLKMPDGKVRTFRRGDAAVDAAINQGAVEVSTAGGAGGGRPLPSAAINNLTEGGTRLDTLERLEQSFQNDYGGSPLLGRAENALGRVMGGAAGAQSQWWQDYQGFINEVRHGLFGGALTPTEMSEFARANVNPGMAPSQIRENLKRQREIAERAIARKAKSYSASGYAAEAIDAAVGRDHTSLSSSVQTNDGGTTASATGFTVNTWHHAGGLPEAARAQLQEGEVTTFGNGQSWTLEGGKPVRVR